LPTVPSNDESSQPSTVSSDVESPATATSGSRSISRASSPVPPPATAVPGTQSARLTDTPSEISLAVAGGSGGDPGGETSVGLVVGVVLAVLLLLIAGIIFLLYFRHRQSTEGGPNEYETEVEHPTDTVEYVETAAVTFEEVFDNPLSAAGVSEDSGDVFKVALEEGMY
jgi:hypothetical protein